MVIKMKNEVIDDNLLTEVTGGDSRTTTLTVDVDLPPVDADLKITVFYDGVLKHARGVLTAYVRTLTFAFDESCGGTHSVAVNIDGIPYRRYELDFDTGTVLETW